MSSLVKFVQDEFVPKNTFPDFGAGDTITVYYEIKEGNKTRTQFFRGVVLQKEVVVVQKRLQLEKCLDLLVLKEYSQLTYLHCKKLK